MTSIDKKEWMNHALKEAVKAKKNNEVPIGAVIVRENKLIGKGFNQVIMKNDPTAHAEIIALRNAALHIRNYRILQSDLYVTLKPCMMCLGAILHARLRAIYFSADDSKSTLIHSQDKIQNFISSNHNITVKGGILKNISAQMLKKFFREKRIKN